MTDHSDNLALFLVLDSVRRSSGLRQHFIAKGLEAGLVAEPKTLPAPGCWPLLTEDEISLGIAMAVNVIRCAGFPHEAAQLSHLSEVHGHG